MNKDSLSYKYTLFSKKEWILFCILTFGILYTKTIEICTLKIFYTSAVLSFNSTTTIEVIGCFSTTHYILLLILFAGNVFSFLNGVKNQKIILFNLCIFIFLFISWILIIILTGGLMDFRLFLYIFIVLFIGCIIHLALAIFFSKRFHESEFYKFQFENLTFWIGENYVNILILLVCSFLGIAIWESFLPQLYLQCDALKLIGKATRFEVKWEQCEYYLIVVFMYYFKCAFIRIKIENFNPVIFIFLILFFILFCGINFIIVQFSIIFDFDLYFFPKKQHITVLQKSFFSFNEVLNYIDEIGMEFFFQLIFVAILVLKDKLDWIVNKRTHDIIKQKDLENLLLKTRLDVLKNQINPHFIFNTLNFISNKSNNYSEELGKSIDTLSNILRYSLEGSLKENEDNKLDNLGEPKDQTAYLKDEINHLKNYIEIHRMRYEGNIFVNLDIDGSTNIKCILPLILINYVENAFKYGEIHDSLHPLIIRIKIEKNHLNFFIKNKKNFKKIESTSVGNKNTQERLAIAYPKRHEISILDEPDFYTVSLNINL